MACDGYEHGSRVIIKDEKLAKKLKMPLGLTGVVIKVNHDKHRLTVRCAGMIASEVSAHGFMANSDPLSNNLEWIIKTAKLNFLRISKLTDIDVETLGVYGRGEVLVKRTDATKIVSAINQLTKTEYILTDVFPNDDEASEDIVSTTT